MSLRRIPKGLTLSVGALAIAVFVCLLAGRHLSQSHRQYEQQAETFARNLTKSLDLTLSSTLDGIDLSLLHAVGEVERSLRRGNIDIVAMHETLAWQRHVLPDLQSMLLTDADGRIICSDDPRSLTTVNLSDRDYFLEAKADPQAELILSKPVISRVNGKVVLALARRVSGPDQAFAGVVAGGIPVDRLRDKLSPIDLGPHGQIGLRDRDMTAILLMANREQPSDNVLSPTMERKIQDNPQGSTYRATRTSDGMRCMASYRRMAKYPMYIFVSTAEEDYLTGWRHEAIIVTTLLAVFLVALLVALFLIRRSWRQTAQAEQDARRNEQELRDILGFLPVPVSFAKRDGTIIFRNRLFEFTFGYSQTDIPTIADWMRLAYPDPAYRNASVAVWEQDVAKALADGSHTPPREYQVCCKDGTVRTASICMRPVGQLMVAVFLDITERKQSEFQLRESESRFRALFEGSRDGFVMVDAKGCFVDANPAFCAMVGYTLEELRELGDFYQITPERWRTWEREEIIEKRLLLGQASGLYEKEYIRKDGRIIPIELTAVSIKGPDGDWMFFCIVRDISERKKTEAELERHRDNLEEVILQRTRELERERQRVEQYFSVTSSLTVVLDLHGNIVRINPYGADHLGWKPEDLTGRNWFRTCLPSNTSEEVYQYFITHVANGANLGSAEFIAKTYENDILTRAGQVRRLLFRNAWVRDEHGVVIGTLSSAIDITTVHEAEIALRQAKEAAEVANRAKSEFLANMSHEIRTPLNAVLGYAQLMARDATLPTKHHQALTVINRSGEHLLQLINDILEMSRIEAGRSDCQPEDCDLYSILEGLRSLFQQRAKERSLDLEIRWMKDVPQFIRIDQRKLRQILINLLSNALKFTVHGRVEVVAAMAHEHLVITVKDTGQGISPGELERLFQPFVQTDTGRRRGDGTGLGLAISNGFARLLGGILKADSIVGNGSTFTIDVPVVAGVAVVRQATSTQVVGLAPGQRSPRLLVADDHAESRELLQDLLRMTGCQVEAVADGAAAVAACQRQQPDLIWMDIDMPVMDGLSAATAIRALPGPLPRIIALTAAAFPENRTRILAGGCDEVLAKPFQEEALFRLMEAVLGIQFVWSDRVMPIAGTIGMDDAAMGAALQRLDPNERNRLHTFVVTGELDAIHDLLTTWTDRDLAQAVAILVREYALDHLLKVLESVARMPCPPDQPNIHPQISDRT